MIWQSEFRRVTLQTKKDSSWLSFLVVLNQLRSIKQSSFRSLRMSLHQDVICALLDLQQQ